MLTLYNIYRLGRTHRSHIAKWRVNAAGVPREVRGNVGLICPALSVRAPTVGVCVLCAPLLPFRGQRLHVGAARRAAGVSR